MKVSFSHVILRNIKFAFISVSLIYLVFLCLIINELQAGDWKAILQRKYDFGISGDLGVVPVIQTAFKVSRRLEFVNSLFWKLTKESNSRNNSMRHNSVSYWNISHHAATIDNLWPDNVYANSLAEHNDRILEQLIWILEGGRNPTSLEKLMMKKIMLLDTLRWWNFKTNDEFRRSCPGFSSKCEFIDRDARVSTGLRLTKAEADAIVTVSDFHHRTKSINIDSDIIRFFYIMESSHTINAILQRNYDILASYWRASNLVSPYSKWVYYNTSVRSQKQDKSYAVGKTKLVAVVMSNCRSPNSRIKYIQELDKYVSVDMYGGCGNRNCPNRNCFDQIKKRYKFYLAFENSNCRDYITEKFFNNSLRYDMIPVVMGAHPDDYKAAAPHHSYISIEDFDEPEDLASYLIYLDRNDTAYNEYFSWKGTGEFIDTKFLCRVCAMTHYADFVPPPPRQETMKWADIDNHKLCLPRHTTHWKEFNF